MGVLETAYKSAIAKPLRIQEIFNEFFGEDRVDMQGYPALSEVESALPDNASLEVVKRFILTWQGQHRTNCFILVHFPRVIVTNEHNRSTEIRHLYAKVVFDMDGKMCGRFSLNRSEYTMLHLANGYMHSHVSTIPLNNLREFQSPCTGTGPINNTICSLSADFDEALWQLFCLELDRYVHVESLAGVPYHRLEQLTNRRYSYCPVATILNYRNKFPSRNSRYVTIFALFTKYLIDEGKLKFHYVNNQYRLAASPTQAVINVSNSFIKWYNKYFNEHPGSETLDNWIRDRVLLRCKYVNGELRKQTGGGRSVQDYLSYIGVEMFTFKGRPVTFSISDDQVSVEENEVIILDPQYVEYIITKLINVINFHYGNNRNEEDSTRKAICFL